MAVGIRNTAFRLELLKETNDVWITQLINFFNVNACDIAGYERPQIIVDLHLNLASSVFVYEHIGNNEDSTPSFRLFLILLYCCILILLIF